MPSDRRFRAPWARSRLRDGALAADADQAACILRGVGKRAPDSEKADGPRFPEGCYLAGCDVKRGSESEIVGLVGWNELLRLATPDLLVSAPVRAA